METIQVPINGQSITLTIRRHQRARRISLRLSAARDGIVMTLPKRASLSTGMNFFHSKADWVLQNVEPDMHIAFAEGVTLPVLGNNYTIRRLDGRGISRLHENELQVYCAAEFIPRRVRDFLRKTLQQECMHRAQAYATQLGKTIREVKIRDTRSRWGSCSRDGRLNFHWQLIFAPVEILDYLVAHEVAHLKEMNHSAAFWKVVCDLYPGFAKARNWLKCEGHRLHRYGK